MNDIELQRPYPLPPNEAERLAALYDYNILDSEPEPGFDRIASTAARLFAAPIAFFSLVDDQRQWFKAKYGFTITETTREVCFCTYAMLEPQPMVVCDATRDIRFLTNPMVTGKMSIRFYVGVPILSRGGLPLGTLGVVDTKVRDYPSQELLNSMTDLALLVSDQLELRSAARSKALAEREHQEQLEIAKRNAESASQAKSDFLARMSHEIRTPMNLIMGMNALLLESPLNEKQRQHVDISYRNIRRLLRLINGILDLSKVEAGQLSFQNIAFDLEELLKESAATISSAIERRGLNFEIRIEPATGLFWRGDPERLQQVLLNLIGNSIKFTSTGQIDVRVSPEPTPLGESGEAGLRFEVSDTGCGIPKDKSGLIFDAFQQAEESMNRLHEGTGLGLSIARTLVEKMAGRIWVEEKPTPGARLVFTVFLPAATAAAVKARKNQEDSAKISHTLAAGARILLAEDNPENVILIRAYLENLALSIEVATNGLEALDMRKQNHYDVVLMDIQMPVMDGYSATREIRHWEEINKMTRVPIVALTAHAFSGASEDSRQAGCDDHLTKPVERHDLLEAIAKYAKPAQPAAADGPPAPENEEEEEEEEMAALVRARRPAFLSNRRSDLGKLRAALDSGDFAVIQSIGHNCKGTGTGYGFPEISRFGLAIEQAAKNHDSEAAQDSIGLLDQFVASACQAANL